MNIRYFEELSMNAWPSLQTRLYDGWVIRFANGYTKRANSINPLYSSTLDVNHKVGQCEQIFKGKCMRTVFKMTSVAYPGDLDHVLEQRGYGVIDNTSVQVLDLCKFSERDLTGILVEKEFNEEWVSNYCILNSVNEGNRETLSKIIKNITAMKFLISLRVNSKTIACGLGVLEREILGIFDVVVDNDYRNKGYGEALVRSLIRIGKNNGAKDAYLQVMLNNAPALKLYSKIGFNELYKYWYRVKD